MLRRVAVAATFVVGGTLLAGCGSRSDEGAALVSKIGWSRLVADASVFKTGAESESSAFVPESSWPASIRELEPQSVRLTRDGVFVRRSARMVEEEGVFISFAGVVVDTRSGMDPSFTPIAPQVYWYEIKG